VPPSHGGGRASRDPQMIRLARFNLQIVSHPDISPKVPALSPFSVQEEIVVACRNSWLGYCQ